MQIQYPQPQSPESLYGEDYYSGKSAYAYEDERKTERFHAHVWDARLTTISRYVSSGRFLDIGCSFGGFLNRARHYGFEPSGVEISPYSASVTRKRGIPVFEGDFLDAHFSDAHFSVVTLIEVIEHLADPRRVFSELFRIIRPGGMVVIQTANFDGWQARNAGAGYHYYLPGHLFYYSYSNLATALKAQGFTRIIPYFGVDFPLLAKLRKSRANFHSLLDYAAWFRIAWYHAKSRFWKKGHPLTSSMVVYAIK